MRKPIDNFAIMAIGDMSGSQLVCKAEEVRELEQLFDEAVELLKYLKSDSCGYPDDHEDIIDDFLTKLKEQK